MHRFEKDVKQFKEHAEKNVTPIRRDLLGDDPLGAISKIAGLYRVARCFNRKYDESVGLARYQPILDGLRSYGRNGGKDPIEAVLALKEDLKRSYHKEVLSASSKFLWYEWGSQIIIYDSQALTAIRKRFPSLKPADYYRYCSAWKSLFNECSQDVAEECARLGASNERWFHERVFDWHLWRLGGLEGGV